MEREVVFAERMEVCQGHPEKAEIFWLEQMLIKAGQSYFFNFWEDLRPVFGGEQDWDPESIDWEVYPFSIEIEKPTEFVSIRVCFDKEDPKLLQLSAFVHRKDQDHTTVAYSGLSAEAAMEKIEEILKND